MIGLTSLEMYNSNFDIKAEKQKVRTLHRYF